MWFIVLSACAQKLAHIQYKNLSDTYNFIDTSLNIVVMYARRLLQLRFHIYYYSCNQCYITVVSVYQFCALSTRVRILVRTTLWRMKKLRLYTSYYISSCQLLIDNHWFKADQLPSRTEALLSNQRVDDLIWFICSGSTEGCHSWHKNKDTGGGITSVYT